MLYGARRPAMSARNGTSEPRANSNYEMKNEAASHIAAPGDEMRIGEIAVGCLAYLSVAQ